MTKEKKKSHLAKRPLKRLVLLVFKKVFNLYVLVILFSISGMLAAISGNIEAAFAWITALMLLLLISLQGTLIELLHDNNKMLRETIVLVHRKMEANADHRLVAELNNFIADLKETARKSKVQAINDYRSFAGCGLREAKRFIDSL